MSELDTITNAKDPGEGGWHDMEATAQTSELETPPHLSSNSGPSKSLACLEDGV